MTAQESTDQNQAVQEKIVKKFPFAKCYICCILITYALLSLISLCFFSSVGMFADSFGILLISLIITGVIDLIYTCITYKNGKKFPFSVYYAWCVGIISFLLFITRPVVFVASIVSLIITGIIALIYKIINVIQKKKEGDAE